MFELLDIVSSPNPRAYTHTHTYIAFHFPWYYWAGLTIWVLLAAWLAPALLQD